MFTKAIFIFLLVNFVSDSYGQKSEKFFRKDYIYIEDVESFYKIHSVPNSWVEAKRICAYEGATFWHPETHHEVHAVTAFWKKDKPRIEYLWTALSDLLVEGQFETIDGKPSSEVYTNWQFNEPDNHKDREHCTRMNKHGEMNDARCHTKSNFICKKTLHSLEWNHQCDMPDLDYIYNKRTGKCYKLHKTPMEWTEANAICQLEQSNLAVINNYRDAEFLVKLTKCTSKLRIKGKYQRGIYHLGYHNKFNDGWQKVNGKRLQIDDEAWFDNYRPENDYKECGSMFFNGRLVNTDCDMKSLFICEHGREHFSSGSGIDSIHSHHSHHDDSSEEKI